MSGRASLLVVALFVSPAAAAPALRSADIRITLTSPHACEVTMALMVEGAEEIDHRIEDAKVDILSVEGARQLGEPRSIGSTRSLVLHPFTSPKPSEGGFKPSYTFRYRSTLPENRAYRCPIWLPAVATDGVSRTVRLDVDLPASVVPGASMPAMAWSGTRGTATLGHVPAFVHVPYVAQGQSAGWSIAQMMDAAAIAAFAVASVVWVLRRRR